MASRIVRVRIYRNDSCATTRVWLWSWVVVYVLRASASIFINWSSTLANDNEEREQIEKKVQKKRVAVRTWLRVGSDLALQFPHWSLVNPGFLSQHAWFLMVFISSGLRHCWQRTWSYLCSNLRVNHQFICLFSPYRATIVFRIPAKIRFARWWFFSVSESLAHSIQNGTRVGALHIRRFFTLEASSVRKVVN